MTAVVDFVFFFPIPSLLITRLYYVTTPIKLITPINIYIDKKHFFKTLQPCDYNVSSTYLTYRENQGEIDDDISPAPL